jgi:hypothetical protein
VLASAASAGPPGTWSRAGKVPGTPTLAAGFARTPDGVLHVVSLRRSGATAELWHTSVAGDGHVLRSNPIVRGWRALANPELVTTPDGGLRVLFGGVRSASAGDANVGLNAATAPAAGGPWTLQPGRVAPSADAARADVGAATAKDGTPVTAWASASGLHYHVGVDPATADVSVALAGCCAHDPEVAFDMATGQAYLGWFSSSPRKQGILVQAIGATRPSGPRFYAPGSARKKRADAVAPRQRTALSGRIGAGGVYLAYGVGFPSFRSIALLRVGAPRPTLRMQAPGATTVGIAAAPQGRLWLFWKRGGRLYATRTNRAANRLGAVRALAPPPGTKTLWHVQGDGSAGPLDLLVNARARGGTTLWHQQVLPQLSLQLVTTSQPDGTVRYTFRVTDAGEPVANASVRFGAQILTTGVPGTVSLTTSDHPPAAIAAKAGYAPGTVRIP